MSEGSIRELQNMSSMSKDIRTFTRQRTSFSTGCSEGSVTVLVGWFDSVQQKKMTEAENVTNVTTLVPH